MIEAMTLALFTTSDSFQDNLIRQDILRPIK
jgi:hypothetical protein